jgi:hypothetical protein
MPVVTHWNTSMINIAQSRETRKLLSNLSYEEREKTWDAALNRARRRWWFLRPLCGIGLLFAFQRLYSAFGSNPFVCDTVFIACGWVIGQELGTAFFGGIAAQYVAKIIGEENIEGEDKGS